MISAPSGPPVTIVARSPQTAADVGGHYDELDAVYREIWGEHVHHGYWRTGSETDREATEALVGLVAERLDLVEGQAVCDIGCGYGASAEYLAQRHAVRVTGLTLSAAQARIGQARTPSAGAVTILVRDWLDSGLGDGVFDRAYAIESSEHMIDKLGFFSEAMRVLKPRGRLVVCAWLACTDPTAFEVRHLLEPICREGRLPSMGSREDYEALARAAGFVQLGFDDIGRDVRRTWTLVSCRVARRLMTDRAFRRFALSPSTRNRSFLLSLPRLMFAMRTGAMRYGVFVWEKPA
jgi:tocopherol O-methyltransferase